MSSRNRLPVYFLFAVISYYLYIDSTFFPACNYEVVKKLEVILAEWIKQFQLAINQMNLIRRETDDAGPADELAYWRNRLCTLTR